MKQGKTALVTAAMLAGTGALYAQPLPPMNGPPVTYDARAYYGGRIAPSPPQMYAPQDLAMPPHEVATILRSRGFLPLSGPVRRGGFYVVSAVHPNGDDGRVVLDAYTGRFVRFVPALEMARAARSDEMVLVYQGPTFPPPEPARLAAAPPPPTAARGVPRPPASVPRVASRMPPSAPLLTPKPRPQGAPPKPETAQAPPVPAPVATKPAAVSPPLVLKPADKMPESPVVQPTRPLPPVQTLE